METTASVPNPEPKKTPRTKVVGYLIIAGAVIKMATDALDGGGFDLAHHADDVLAALAGAGFVFFRDALGRIENQIKKL